MLFKYGADYRVYNGLFRQTSPATYDAGNHVRIPAEAFQRFIWNLDFQHPYKQMLAAYWKDGLNTYRDAAKVNFIAACNKQAAEGSLGAALLFGSALLGAGALRRRKMAVKKDAMVAA